MKLQLHDNFRIKKSLPFVFLFIACFSAFYAAGCNPRNWLYSKEQMIEREKEQTRLTEEAVKNSPVLQELSNICSEIPKPAEFTFINKSKGNNFTFIAFGYYSKYDFKEAKTFYENHFTQQGWEFRGNGGGINSEWITFRKDKYEIQISHGVMGEDVNYAFTCEKLK